MLFSMMSTTALAFADETGDSTSVSTDVTDAPAAEEADAVDSGSSNDADSSDATSAPTITDVVDLTHESYEDANSNDETTQDATSDVVDGKRLLNRMPTTQKSLLLKLQNPLSSVCRQ